MVPSHFHLFTTFGRCWAMNGWAIHQLVGGRGNLLGFLTNISRFLMNSNDR